MRVRMRVRVVMRVVMMGMMVGVRAMAAMLLVGRFMRLGSILSLPVRRGLRPGLRLLRGSSGIRDFMLLRSAWLGLRLLWGFGGLCGSSLGRDLSLLCLSFGCRLLFAACFLHLLLSLASECCLSLCCCYEIACCSQEALNIFYFIIFYFFILFIIFPVFLPCASIDKGNVTGSL